MNILVTGGAGYKGTLLVKKLLERGYDVTLLDNFMYGYSSVLHLVQEPRLTVVQLDIRNLEHKTLAGFKRGLSPGGHQRHASVRRQSALG